jgi:hypothetical protein
LKLPLLISHRQCNLCDGRAKIVVGFSFPSAIDTFLCARIACVERAGRMIVNAPPLLAMTWSSSYPPSAIPGEHGA